MDVFKRGAGDDAQSAAAVGSLLVMVMGLGGTGALADATERNDENMKSEGGDSTTGSGAGNGADSASFAAAEAISS